MKGVQDSTGACCPRKERLRGGLQGGFGQCSVETRRWLTASSSVARGRQGHNIQIHFNERVGAGQPRADALNNGPADAAAAAGAPGDHPHQD